MPKVEMLRSFATREAAESWRDTLRPEGRITFRDRRFVVEYLVDEPITPPAIVAVPSKSTAAEREHELRSRIERRNLFEAARDKEKQELLKKIAAQASLKPSRKMSKGPRQRKKLALEVRARNRARARALGF